MGDNFVDVEIDDGRFVRVALVQIYDRQRIDLRHWARFFDGDDFHPTKKGIQMDLDFFRDKLYPVFSGICNKINQNNEPISKPLIDKRFEHI